MYNVRLFSADVKATAQVAGPYQPGDRHAMLIFHRQRLGTDYEWELAKAGAADAGWVEVTLQRAGIIDAENLNGKDADFRDAFQNAMRGNCSLIVYRDVLDDDV